MGEWRYTSNIIVLSTLWSRVVSLTPRPLYIPRETAPGTHYIEVWLNLRASLDAVEKRECLYSALQSNPDHSAVEPLALNYTDWAIPYLFPNKMFFFSITDSFKSSYTCNTPVQKPMRTTLEWLQESPPEVMMWSHATPCVATWCTVGNALWFTNCVCVMRE
jgi:hypothetical protein